jgi:hypothetical protein
MLRLGHFSPSVYNKMRMSIELGATAGLSSSVKLVKNAALLDFSSSGTLNLLKALTHPKKAYNYQRVIPQSKHL